MAEAVVIRWRVLGTATAVPRPTRFVASAMRARPIQISPYRAGES
jgi:hypothetical protein